MLIFSFAKFYDYELLSFITMYYYYVLITVYYYYLLLLSVITIYYIIVFYEWLSAPVTSIGFFYPNVLHH